MNNSSPNGRDVSGISDGSVFEILISFAENFILNYIEVEINNIFGVEKLSF
jgi:hypothetical protein